MTHLAITQGTADWLLLKTGLLDALFDFLKSEAQGFPSLRDGDFAEGPFRMATSAKPACLAVWNTDYIGGTGGEAWGFILLDKENGLFGQPDIAREVLERCIYVINQRLQGLLIDGAFIHRSLDEGAHSCLAGRGTRARHFSIGYFERAVEVLKAPQRSIVCVGPTHDPTFSIVGRNATKEGRRLPSLVAEANELQSSNRRRPALPSGALPDLRSHLSTFVRQSKAEYTTFQVATKHEDANQWDPYRVQGLSYDEWLAERGPLTDNQRRILRSTALTEHPLRIVGPGGSGKTVLMQLLATRLFKEAQARGQPVRILYVVHNAAMRQKVAEKFEVLLERPLSSFSEESRIDVMTLSDYGQRQLGLTSAALINADANEAKAFQLERVVEAMEATLKDKADLVGKSPLLSQVRDSPQLQQIFAVLLMAEISTAIKGHGLEADRKRYIESEVPLSRLHAILKPKEREFVFEVFARYHREVFEYYQVLDTDDIAVSLLGRLRTPLWELKRRETGYDFVFVDETQLFNENERRVFPLITKGNTQHVPIALALDEAQQLYGQRAAGMATLGIKDIANESLPSIYRSTRSIVQLAFFVVQRCTDLFSADFPDFTSIADILTPDSHPLAAKPCFGRPKDEHTSLARATADKALALRAANFWQIAVVCHSDLYWDSLFETLNDPRLPLLVIQQRGERVPPGQPAVVLARPAHIGGQEFDAVIAVGLEQGVIPPRVIGNDALAAAVEQQALREIYLSITRARYRFISMLSDGAAPTSILAEAAKSGLIQDAREPVTPDE